MRFTKTTYRKARRAALARLLDFNDIVLLEGLELGDEEFDRLQESYNEALDLGFRIVARGRREKGLWP